MTHYATVDRIDEWPNVCLINLFLGGGLVMTRGESRYPISIARHQIVEKKVLAEI